MALSSAKAITVSKRKNGHIDAGKIADLPRYNAELARGNRNRATLAVARKLAAFLLAVDRRAEVFSITKPTVARPPEPLPAGKIESSRAERDLSCLPEVGLGNDAFSPPAPL
jgi:hypothetical protein